MHPFLKYVFFGYFFTHIPITICLDLQGVLGQFYPEALRSFFRWYTTTFNDRLMTDLPIWLKSFLVAELFLQLPFFFVACYGIWNEKNWIRIPSIIYGAHVSTTVLPILAEIICADQDFSERMLLVSFYAPYFIIPALLAGVMAANPVPFPAKGSKSQ